jgi:hypothetical protein
MACSPARTRTGPRRPIAPKCRVKIPQRSKPYLIFVNPLCCRTGQGQLMQSSQHNDSTVHHADQRRGGGVCQR